MKKIKRIAAIIIAGCLLMGLLCASFAEETKEIIAEEATNSTIQETAGADRVPQGAEGITEVPYFRGTA